MIHISGDQLVALLTLIVVGMGAFAALRSSKPQSQAQFVESATEMMSRYEDQLRRCDARSAALDVQLRTVTSQRDDALERLELARQDVARLQLRLDRRKAPRDQ